jgi:Tol biopolymer transport system component
VPEVTDPASPWDLQARQINSIHPTEVGSWYFPRWSPDGATIAVVAGTPGASHMGVRLVAADGSQATLFDPRSVDVNPEWAPSGARLSLVRMTGTTAGGVEQYDGYLVDPDNSNAVKLSSPKVSGYLGLVCSPDGSRVVGHASVSDTDEMPGDLVIITLDGSVPPVRVPAQKWSTSAWQPVVTADSPVAAASIIPGGATLTP